MKIWTWIKSLSLVTIVGAAAGAIYMVFNAVRASQLEDRAAAAEEREISMLSQGTTKALAKASKLQAGAAKDKESAAARRKNAEAHLEKLSEDRTMADIADSFNKRKLRKQAGSST